MPSTLLVDIIQPQSGTSLTLSNNLIVTGSTTAASFTGAGTGLTGTASSLTAGSVSAISSGLVTTALGYTPYNSSNPVGYITASDNAATSTSIAGGSTGTVLYQSAAGITAKLTVGTNGHVLTLAGGLPTWAAANGGGGGAATNLYNNANLGGF